MTTTRRGTFVALGVLALILLLIPVVGGGMMGAGMMGPGMMSGYGTPPSTSGPGGWSWGLGMGLGWLMMLAFWGAVLLGVALLVGWLGGGRGNSAPNSALEILRRRFAAGELTPEQFEQMRRTLHGAA
jgi:putative membrane protein